MAGENYHHGPEIIENFDGSASVKDVKAAVTLIIGTAPVQDVYATPEARSPFINGLSIVRTQKQASEMFGDPKTSAGYTIPAALYSCFNKDTTGKGAGTYVVVNVFDPDVHKTGATPDPTLVGATDIVGGTTVGGAPYGLDLAYACYNRFGFFPRRIIAPGFTGLTGVRAKMETVANKVRGHAIFDMTPGMTKDQAIAARGVAGAFNTANERAVLCYPRVRALDPVTGDMTLQPYSQHFAGVWNVAAMQTGPHRSPSNRPMPDVNGTETDIYFAPGVYDTDTNLLNEKGIVTTMTTFGSGFQTWGAHSAKFATVSDQMAWLHARATMDVLEDAILFYMLPYTDNFASPAIVNLVEERIRAYLHTKEPGGDGWLYGSEFYFDRQRNTAEQIANEGHVYYTLKTAIMGIMHRITIESYIDLNFVNTALGLVVG